jgi:GTPase SAR1 family protein
MAVLLPADFDVSVLPHSERALIEALRRELDDEWTLVPRVVVASRGKDGEIDLVAVSRTRGGIVFEVKGGQIAVVDGRFVQNGRVLDKSPIDQVVAAKHGLVGRMKAMGVSLAGIYLQHALCFPDVDAFDEDAFGVTCPARAIFTAQKLQWPRQAVEALVGPPHAPVADATLSRFLRAVCPDVPQAASSSTSSSASSSSRYFVSTERDMHRATRDMLLIARGADVNRRILLTGGPGSGKTAVVRAWVDQAVDRGERVAVMSFNKPVSTWLASKASRAAFIGTFHELCMKLARPLGHQPPEKATPAYFRDELPGFVRTRVEQVPERFDTVIVDEGQDFFPHWFALLESLLLPTGPRRLLIAADPGQAINVEDWTPPDDMMRLHCPVNLRNSREIAAFARPFGGGEPYLHNPLGPRPRFVVAGGRKERSKHVRAAVAAAVLDDGIPPARVLVVGVDHETAGELRDVVVERPDGAPIRLVPWDERDEESVVCESVRRAKGLEATAVVFVCRDDAPDRRRFGVGISRARLALTIVGPETLGRTLGLVTSSS